MNMKNKRQYYHYYATVFCCLFLLIGLALPTNSVYAKGKKNNDTQQQVSIDSDTRYPININTADANTLSMIPGIGKARAESIAAYRNEHGHFKTVDDLAKVRGITSNFIEKYAEYITVK